MILCQNCGAEIAHVYHAAESLEILQSVSDDFGVTIAAMVSESRRAYVVAARHEAMRRMRREIPFMTLKEIGLVFGGRDHSTVHHGVQQAEARLAS